MQNSTYNTLMPSRIINKGQLENLDRQRPRTFESAKASQGMPNSGRDFLDEVIVKKGTVFSLSFPQLQRWRYKLDNGICLYLARKDQAPLAQSMCLELTK